MRPFLRRFSRDRRGVAALEAALLSPLALLVFMGTLELSQLIRVETKLVRATQTIQDIVAATPEGDDVTSSMLANDFGAGQIIMLPFAGSKLTAAIASVSFNSSAAATEVDWQELENGSSGMTVATACAAAASMSLGSDSVIVVETSYVYVPLFHYILGRTFTLTQIAYGRPRYEAQLTDSSTSNGATGNC